MFVDLKKVYSPLLASQGKIKKLEDWRISIIVYNVDCNRTNKSTCNTCYY